MKRLRSKMYFCDMESKDFMWMKWNMVGIVVLEGVLWFEMLRIGVVMWVCN